MSAFAPLWYFMILTGRMPFSGGINETGHVEVILSRKSWRFVIFCLTSLLLLLVMVSSLTSTIMSYDEFTTGKAEYKIKYDEYQSKPVSNRSIHPPNDTMSPYL